MSLRIRKFELQDVWSRGTKRRCCCHRGFWLINVKKCLKVRWDRRDWIFYRFAVSLPLTYWSVFFLRSPPRSTVFLAFPSQTVTSRSLHASQNCATPIADSSQAAQHELNSWPLRLGVMSRASALTPQASGGRRGQRDWNLSQRIQSVHSCATALQVFSNIRTTSCPLLRLGAQLFTVEASHHRTASEESLFSGRRKGEGWLLWWYIGVWYQPKNVDGF